MNDEQLSPAPSEQAEQDNDAVRAGNTNGNGGGGSAGANQNQGQNMLAGSVGEAEVGDVGAPTQGFPMPKAEGHPAPEPSTRNGELTPSMQPEQAEALTSYHPVEPIGETPEEGREARAEEVQSVAPTPTPAAAPAPTPEAAAPANASALSHE